MSWRRQRPQSLRMRSPEPSGPTPVSAPTLTREATLRYRCAAAFAEVAVRERLKQAGGKWNPDRKVWRFVTIQAVALGLDTRIVDELPSTSRCREERAGYLYVDARPTSRTRCSHTPPHASISWQMPAFASRIPVRRILRSAHDTRDHA